MVQRPWGEGGVCLGVDVFDKPQEAQRSQSSREGEGQGQLTEGLAGCGKEFRFYSKRFFFFFFLSVIFSGKS